MDRARFVEPSPLVNVRLKDDPQHFLLCAARVSHSEASWLDSLGDALSVLLFDYMSELKAAWVLERLDLERLIPARIAIPPSSPRH